MSMILKGGQKVCDEWEKKKRKKWEKTVLSKLARIDRKMKRNRKQGNIQIVKQYCVPPPPEED
jgi:hypothetical protein